jgi:hypothetical protein
MKLRSVLLSVVGSFAILSSCKSVQKATAQREADCRTVMCTMDFRSVTVKVVDRTGKPVLLDRYGVTDSKKGVHSRGTDAKSNIYTITDDSLLKLGRNARWKLIFFGNAGSKAIQQEFIIGTDCCHVFRISGPEELVLP